MLHVIRYSADQLDTVLAQINQTGYGLTLGVHSRIQAFANTVFRNSIAGNTYINRNMVGAVVGVNPFGGRGLSGTGPKAGGPNYLLRFSASAAPTACQQPYVIDLSDSRIADPVLIKNAVAALSDWHGVSVENRVLRLKQCNLRLSRFEAMTIEKLASPVQLPGPTGEDNRLSLQARGPVVLVIRDEDTIAAAEQQIVGALLWLLIGCPPHWAELQSMQLRYQQAELQSFTITVGAPWSI